MTIVCKLGQPIVLISANKHSPFPSADKEVDPQPSIQDIADRLNAMSDGVPTILQYQFHQNWSNQLNIYFCTPDYVLRCVESKQFETPSLLLIGVNAIRTLYFGLPAWKAMYVKPSSWTVLQTGGSYNTAQVLDQLKQTFQQNFDLLPVSTAQTAALPPQQLEYLEQVERLIDASAEIEEDKARLTDHCVYKRVEPVAVERIVDDTYIFVLDQEVTFKPGTQVWVGLDGKGLDDERQRRNGRIVDAEEDRLTIRFDGQIDLAHLQCPGVLGIVPSDIQQRVQKRAVEALKNRQALNESLLDVIVDHVYRPYQPSTLQAPTNLLPAQKDVFQKALTVPDLLLVWGPPGTGKTTTILSVVEALAKQHQKILVTSKNNLAVDNVLEGLKRNEGLRLIRIGDEAKVSPATLDLLIDEQARRLQERLTKKCGAQIERLNIQIKLWQTIAPTVVELRQGCATWQQAAARLEQVQGTIRAKYEPLQHQAQQRLDELAVQGQWTDASAHSYSVAHVERLTAEVALWEAIAPVVAQLRQACATWQQATSKLEQLQQSIRAKYEPLQLQARQRLDELSAQGQWTDTGADGYSAAHVERLTTQVAQWQAIAPAVSQFRQACLTLQQAVTSLAQLQRAIRDKYEPRERQGQTKCEEAAVQVRQANAKVNSHSTTYTMLSQRSKLPIVGPLVARSANYFLQTVLEPARVRAAKANLRYAEQQALYNTVVSDYHAELNDSAPIKTAQQSVSQAEQLRDLTYQKLAVQVELNSDSVSNLMRSSAMALCEDLSQFAAMGRQYEVARQWLTQFSVYNQIVSDYDAELNDSLPIMTAQESVSWAEEVRDLTYQKLTVQVDTSGGSAAQLTGTASLGLCDDLSQFAVMERQYEIAEQWLTQFSVYTKIVSDYRTELNDSPPIKTAQESLAQAEEVRDLTYQKLSAQVNANGGNAATLTGSASLGLCDDLSQFDVLERHYAIDIQRLELLKDWMEHVVERQQALYPALIRSADVLGATCIGIASNARFRDLEFDIAIVDEAGQIQVFDLLVPLVRAKRAILVGDHQQLPPFAEQALVQRFDRENDEHTPMLDMLEKSLFECLIAPITPQERRERHGMLDRQQRVPGLIADFISTIFYEGSYTSPTEKYGTFTEPVFTHPFCFVDTRNVNGYGEQYHEEQKTFTNAGEARVLARIVAYYVHHGVELTSIGIIVPYRLQIGRVQAAVRKLLSDVSDESLRDLVASVDSFQGKERDIILFGFTRSNAKGGVGFLSELRRLNVAMTRARRNLIMVGDLKTLTNADDEETKRFCQKLRDYVTDHGQLLSVTRLKKALDNAEK